MTELQIKWTAAIRLLHSQAETDGVTIISAFCADEAVAVNITGQSQEVTIELATLIAKVPMDVSMNAIEASIQFREENQG